ncbi:type VI secretion system tube protein TssD [Aquimarina litoralis]|uniref:type VI secretion system tube protein TssD n=1 Tax=Aquimarina litoralis TaxID=584605 RepID=UPI001C58B729|nr:type VI secretion system tube protein TssD [Aquimarina litoralis]MBW1296747.1 phage tail protein [Aquimarina litoralis]
MSFNATVELEGKTFNVLNFNYSLFRETDATGRPSSILRGGRGTWEVESNVDDAAISDIAYDSYRMTNVKMTFFKRDTKATAKEITFTDAYIVKYEESFESTGNTPARIRFTVSAREVETRSSSLVNEWV